MSKKELLYKKLGALRLEVHSSIVEDIVATANEAFQEQYLQQCSVSGWQEFEKQKPEAGQLIIVRNSKSGQQQIINWSRLFSHLLKLEYDRWYPLPDIH